MRELHLSRKGRASEQCCLQELTWENAPGVPCGDTLSDVPSLLVMVYSFKLVRVAFIAIYPGQQHCAVMAGELGRQLCIAGLRPGPRHLKVSLEAGVVLSQ